MSAESEDLSGVNETVKEAAKAGQELGKAGKEIGKAVRKGFETTEKFGAFLKEVFGPSAVEAGGMFHDYLKHQRELNGIHLRQKFQRKLREMGVAGETHPVPLSFGMPLLEKATLEDDETLQEMWAGLLASAVDPSQTNPPRRAFVNILANLEPLDAQILQFLGKQGWNLFDATRHPQVAVDPDKAPGMPRGFNVERLSESLRVEENAIRLSLLNLYKEGCLEGENPATIDSLDVLKTGLAVHDKSSIFRPSMMGWELLKATGAKV